MSLSLTSIVSTIQHGGPRLTLAVFILAQVLGIVVLHYVFRALVSILSRHTEIPPHVLAHVVRFMPFMTGICTGIYAMRYFMELPEFIENHIDMIFYNMVAVTVTLFVAHLISALIQYKMMKSQARNSSTSILSTIINIFVYASGMILILNAHGISISPILTAMGAGGIASAPALQDTLANLFSGIMTLVSRQVRIGDYIQLSTGATGRITDMNWRNTTMRTPTGNTIIIPNKTVAGSMLINYEQPLAECTITIPLTVVYGSDLEHVEAVTIDTAKAILAKSQYGVTGFHPAVRYTELGAYGISFQVVLRIKNVLDEGILKHQFIKAIYQAYQEADIKLLERTA